MDNYKQNNGEHEHWTLLSCPGPAPALSLYHIISERKQKQTGWRDISHNSAEWKTLSGSLKGSLPSRIVRETFAIFKKTDRWGNLSRWWYDDMIGSQNDNND